MKKERVMHLIVLLIVAALIAVIPVPNTARAGDSGSFAVSCTMPAIPGLNVPIIEEETVKTDTTAKVTATTEQEKDINIQKEKQELPPIMMIQQDREKEIRLVTGQSPALIVKTLYVR